MMTDKRIASSFLLVLMASALWLAGLSGVAAQSADETKLIARAEQAISELKTVQAKFIQVSSDGTTGEGRIYFRRPTQLRLDYIDPETLSIVTSSVWVYLDDKQAKTVEAYPVSETPFAPLLEENVSFRSDQFTTSARIEEGIAYVQMEKETGEGAGSLTLEFNTNSWQLRRWVITDVLGVETTVTLQNPIYGRDLDNRLFGVPSYDNSN